MQFSQLKDENQLAIVKSAGKILQMWLFKKSQNKKKILFLLWGAFAQSKEKLIDTSKHFILKTTHPSPFSAHRGFLGSNCFKETNEILEKIGKTPIDWSIE